MAYTEPFLYFVEYIFGKYAAKLYLCSQIQDNDEKKNNHKNQATHPMYMHDTTATDLFVLQQSFQRIICT